MVGHFRSKFGHKLHETAWFIAIHAISKPKILKKALTILEDALHKGEKVAPEYAGFLIVLLFTKEDNKFMELNFSQVQRDFMLVIWKIQIMLTKDVFQ